MRLQVLSDLHLEFWPLDITGSEADVIVLAGDIHVGNEALKWIERRFPDQEVVYVLGNHEYYHNSIPELATALKKKTQNSHIHVLENDAVEVGGFTFLGCTLWSDFRIWHPPETAMILADRRLSDYRLIQVRAEKALFRPWRSAKLFDESAAWLKWQLDNHDPAKTVVVTHHTPSPKSIPPRFQGDPVNGAFVSDLEEMLRDSGIPLWVHGHQHYNVDYKIGKTRVFSNQRGYPRAPIAGFRANRIIKV